MTEDFPKEHTHPQDQEGTSIPITGQDDASVDAGRSGYPKDIDGEPTTEVPLVDLDAGKTKDK